jgi:hypothetical protein
VCDLSTSIEMEESAPRNRNLDLKNALSTGHLRSVLRASAVTPERALAAPMLLAKLKASKAQQGEGGGQGGGTGGAGGGGGAAPPDGLIPSSSAGSGSAPLPPRSGPMTDGIACHVTGCHLTQETRVKHAC